MTQNKSYLSFEEYAKDFYPKDDTPEEETLDDLSTLGAKLALTDIQKIDWNILKKKLPN